MGFPWFSHRFTQYTRFFVRGNGTSSVFRGTPSVARGHCPETTLGFTKPKDGCQMKIAKISGWLVFPPQKNLGTHRWLDILVGGFRPSEKYYSIGIIIPNIGKNKKCSKPPIRYIIYTYYCTLNS